MYQIPELLKFPKLFHAFSTKADGNMSNSILGKTTNFDTVLKNRKKFLERVRVGMNKCACMWVKHEDEIVEVPEKSVGVSMKDSQKALRVDGLITDKNGVCLFLLIADCLPIIFYDPKKEVISLVHAGWRGVDLEIVKRAIKKMQSEYSSKPKDIIVGIGPYAHKQSFIKRNPIQKSDFRWESFIDRVRPRRPHKKEELSLYRVDLLGFAKKQLVETGVLKRNIFVSDVDTVKDERFFSHVREKDLPIKKQGRFACVVGMV